MADAPARVAIKCFGLYCQRSFARIESVNVLANILSLNKRRASCSEGTATNTVSYIRPRSQSCYWRRQRRVAAVGVASSVFTFCPRVLAQPTPTNSVLHPCDFGKHLYSLRNRRTCTIIMFYIDDDDYDVCLRYLFENENGWIYFSSNVTQR